MSKPQTDPRKQKDSGFDDFLRIYRLAPVEFVEEVLNQTPLPWQKKFMNAVASGKRRISVRAGHGVGKSTV